MLAVVMIAGMFPTNALALIDTPIGGGTGSGWGEFFPNDSADDSFGNSQQTPPNDIVSGAPDEALRPSVTPPGSIPDWEFDIGGIQPESGLPGPDADYGASNLPPVDDSNRPDEETTTPPSTGPPADEQPVATEEEAVADDELAEGPYDNLQESWLQTYQRNAAAWGRLRNSGAPSSTSITWGGNPIVFANNTFIGSPFPRVSVQGQVAFSYNASGSASYNVQTILSNFMESSQSSQHYLAAQALIWADTFGTSVRSWGNSGVTASIVDQLVILRKKRRAGRKKQAR